MNLFLQGANHSKTDYIRDLLVYGCLPGDKQLGKSRTGGHDHSECDGLCAVRTALHFILCFRAATSQILEKKSKPRFTTNTSKLAKAMRDIVCYMRGGCQFDYSKDERKEKEKIRIFIDSYNDCVKVYDETKKKIWRPQSNLKHNLVIDPIVVKPDDVQDVHKMKMYLEMHDSFKSSNCNDIISVLQMQLDLEFGIKYGKTRSTSSGPSVNMTLMSNSILSIEPEDSLNLQLMFKKNNLLFKNTRFIVLQYDPKRRQSNQNRFDFETIQVQMARSYKPKKFPVNSPPIKETEMKLEAVVIKVEEQNCKNSKHHYSLIRRSPIYENMWLILDNGVEEPKSYSQVVGLIGNSWVRLLYLKPHARETIIEQTFNFGELLNGIF